ncbi:hypothetical protein GIB67_002792 [Kingdonia uniflora]|uniref:Uncharacterized protein n=1 Tax=Kingdonia uniflora TaxID=39325 RepID=A0A7J7LUK5_9MAGN|nr:hypothetical protein GIB67_002792 [Kingdonia uniflora]
MQSKSESFCEEEPEEIKKPAKTFPKDENNFGINDLKAAKNLVRQEEKVTTKMYHVEKMDIFQEYGGQLPEEELGDSAPIELELSVRVEEVNIDNWDDEQEHRKGKIVEVICLLSSQDGDQLIEVNPDEAENAHDDPLHTGEGRLDSLSPNVLMTRKKAKKIGTRKTRKKLISHELIADQISQQLNFHDCGVNLLYSLDTILREGKFQIEIELYLSDREEGEGDGTNKVDTTVRVSIEELQVSVGSDKVDQAYDENGHGGKNKVGGQEPADEKILKDIDVVVGVRVGVENINTMSRMLYSVKS